MQPDSVLIVEDDAALGEVLTELLEDAGYAVHLARGGNEALNLLAQHSFTVVVSDFCMPRVTGINVLQAAHQSPSRPEVILLTGYATLDTAMAASQEGAFAYLRKPCRPEKLLERVADAAIARTMYQQPVHVLQYDA